MGKIVEKLREKYQVDAEQTALIDAIEVEFEQLYFEVFLSVSLGSHGNRYDLLALS